MNISSGRIMANIVFSVNSAKFPAWITVVGMPASLEACSTFAFATIQGMRIPCSEYRRQKSEGEKSWTLVLGMAFTKPYCLSVPSSPTRELGRLLTWIRKYTECAVAVTYITMSMSCKALTKASSSRTSTSIFLT